MIQSMAKTPSVDSSSPNDTSRCGPGAYAPEVDHSIHAPQLYPLCEGLQVTASCCVQLPDPPLMLV